MVVNVQGDLPTIDPAADRGLASCPLADPAVDIATLVARSSARGGADRPQRGQDGRQPRSRPGRFRALYFTRATAPYGDGPLYHHIGLYAYRRRALQRFVGLPPSPLERRERLEQLRALEAGMRIDAIRRRRRALGVDTPHDLERARAIIARPGGQP